MPNESKSSGWSMVLGSTLALVVGGGALILFTFGIFLRPIAEEMGWNRGTMSLGVTASLTLAGLATPIVGYLIDKYGVRIVTLTAVTLFSASFGAIALTPSQIGVFIALYALAGLMSSGHAPLPYAKVITAGFDGRRGLALGIAMAGIGIGGALLPQVAEVFVRSFGWREAYLALAALTWLVAFPSILFLVKEPDFAKGTSLEASVTAVIGSEVREAFRSRSFWFISVAILLVVTVVNGTIAHLVALLTDKGMAPTIAATMLIGVGLSTIAGRLVTGYLLDRVFAPHLAAAIFLVPLIGILILWSGAATPILGLTAAICLGFGLGAEVDAIGFLVGRYFGLRRYGEIYGYIFAIFQIGAGIGPYLMGLSFDVTGSYNSTLLAFGIMLLAASAIISSIGPYRFPVQPTIAAK